MMTATPPTPTQPAPVQMAEISFKLHHQLASYRWGVENGARLIREVPVSALRESITEHVAKKLRAELECIDRLSMELRELVNAELALVHMTPDEIASTR